MTEFGVKEQEKKSYSAKRTNKETIGSSQILPFQQYYLISTINSPILNSTFG